MKEWKSLHVYVCKGRVIVPTVAQTDAGYVDVEPVDVADANDITAVAKAIGIAMWRGNPARPAPLRKDIPKPVVLEQAGMKSWRMLERTAFIATIHREDQGYEMMVWNPGATDDEFVSATLPLRADALTIAQNILRLIQEKPAPSANEGQRPEPKSPL